MHLLRPFILGSIRLRATTILIRKHLEQPITYSHYVPTIDICSMHDIYEIFLDILFHYSRKIDKIVLYISKPSKNPHDFLRGLAKKTMSVHKGRGVKNVQNSVHMVYGCLLISYSLRRICLFSYRSRINRRTFNK